MQIIKIQTIKGPKERHLLGQKHTKSTAAYMCRKRSSNIYIYTRKKIISLRYCLSMTDSTPPSPLTKIGAVPVRILKAVMMGAWAR